MAQTTDRRPKTVNQVRCIYGEARRHGLDDEALHELVASVLMESCQGSSPTVREGAVSIASLTYAQAEAVIQRLKGRGFVPRRTLQYRRQKAHVHQLVTREQLTLIAELASQRNWSAQTLADFCRRQCKAEKPRTTGDANKVIEALKAMNKREGLWAA